MKNRIFGLNNKELNKVYLKICVFCLLDNKYLAFCGRIFDLSQFRYAYPNTQKFGKVSGMFFEEVAEEKISII